MPDPIIVTTSGPLGGSSITRKSILQIIQEACRVIGLGVPNAVFSSSSREHIELQLIANEMAERIAFNTHDWTKLKVKGTITGDGETESFTLPEDYKRMLKTTQLWPVGGLGLNTPLIHEPDTDQWLGMESLGGPWACGVWTIIGEDIYVKPVVADEQEIEFYYLSSLFAMSELAQYKTEFDADTDVFLLDDRLLRLGIIWQWKQLKGFPYSEDMATYEEALAYLIGNDKGSNIITVGRRGSITGSRIAYPRPLGS
jgi:hypothetical protein